MAVVPLPPAAAGIVAHGLVSFSSCKIVAKSPLNAASDSDSLRSVGIKFVARVMWYFLVPPSAGVRDAERVEILSTVHEFADRDQSEQPLLVALPR